MSHENYQSVIQTLHECMTACNHCYDACLKEEDVKMMVDCIVSPHSNNAYKHAAPPGTIHVSIKGGAFPMPQQKLTIVPVTLHTENENNSATKPTVLSSNPTCTIKTANAEISFFNGVDEHIIQAVMRELKNG